MNEKTLFMQWHDSMNFFKKDQLKTFFLVSLNTMRRSLVAVFTIFPLSLIVAALTAFMFFAYGSFLLGGEEVSDFSPILGRVSFFPSIMLWLFHNLFVVVAVLLTRSSTERKDIDYIRKYFNKVLVLLLFLPILHWPKALYFLCDYNPSLRGAWGSLKASFRLTITHFPVIVSLGVGHILLTLLGIWFPSLLYRLVFGAGPAGCSLTSLGGICCGIASILLGYVVPVLFHSLMIFFIYSCFAAYYDRVKYAEHEQFFE